jgi:hypothetical protein
MPGLAAKPKEAAKIAQLLSEIGVERIEIYHYQKPDKKAAQLIQKKLGEKADESVTKFNQFIIDETKRANKIISDLLIFARQKAPTLSPLKAADLINYAHEMLLPNATTSGVALSKGTLDSSITIMADKEQIFQLRVDEVKNRVKRTYGYFNNHFNASAVKNAVELLQILEVASPEQEAALAKIKEIIHEGSIRRIIIKKKDGGTVLEIPMTLGVVGALIAPQLAAIGAIAALVTEATVVVEKIE